MSSPPQMRAILIKDEVGPIENLYLGEFPRPVPAPGQVLVKIKAFGLNRMDIMQREGEYPLPPLAPKLLGVEFSGIVEQVGPLPEDDALLLKAAKRWKKGDEVFGLAYGGAYAEYIVSFATHLIAKPAYLSWVEAAGIPENYLTAFLALFVLAELKAGENVLVHAAASGVGLAAIQLSRVFGAKTVTGTTSTAEKIKFITDKSVGATNGVNYRDQDFSAEIKKITDGHGVDVLIDFVGKSHWSKNIDSLAKDGRMILLAILSGSEVEHVDIGKILFNRLRIQGSTLRARSVEFQANLIKRFENQAVQKITGASGDGELKVHIHRVYPWDRIQDAHREMEENKNSGKIVVEVV